LKKDNNDLIHRIMLHSIVARNNNEGTYYLI
jgi:hypothetical protein